MEPAREYAHTIMAGRLPSIRKWKQRRVARVKRIVIHRCSVIEASKGRLTDSPADTARFFMAKYDWPSHPYHFQVEQNGSVYQTAKLSDLTYGVKGIPFGNTTSIHVKVVGNFTRMQPGYRQFQAAAALCVDLIGYLTEVYPGAKIAVRGHSPETVRLRLKRCPGKHFDMDRFRRLVDRECGGIRSSIVMLPIDEDWFLP